MTSKQDGFAKCREIENASAFLERVQSSTSSRPMSRSREISTLADPFHPSMQFKPLVGKVWSVRIGDHHRALARFDGDLVVWFCIGTHEEYNNLIKQTR